MKLLNFLLSDSYIAIAIGLIAPVIAYLNHFPVESFWIITIASIAWLIYIYRRWEAEEEAKKKPRE